MVCLRRKGQAFSSRTAQESVAERRTPGRSGYRRAGRAPQSRPQRLLTDGRDGSNFLDARQGAIVRQGLSPPGFENASYDLLSACWRTSGEFRKEVL
jgi:hypothetical protein